MSTASQLPMTEAEWQSRVLDYALLRGWLCHHTRPARTTSGWRTPVQGHKGFPDWVFARDSYVLFVELKTQSGRLTPEQRTWHRHLKNKYDCVTHGLQLFTWRPSDWDDVQKVLA